MAGEGVAGGGVPVAERRCEDAAPGASHRLLFVVTHPMTARLLLRGQLAWLAGRGFEVAVAASPGPLLDEVAAEEGVPVFPVPMAREIAPAADAVALARLRAAIRRFRPHTINAGTPKAGLLGMLAARSAGVPRRLYTVRGLRLETVRGARRAVLAAAERTAAACAHRVAFVSPSLRHRYLELGLASAAKAVVPGDGSSNGVDMERFRPAAAGEREALRLAAGIPPTAPVIGFVGRFTRDKGIADLAEAFFGPLAERFPDARLLLLGDFEAGDPVPPEVARRLASERRVVRPGFVADTAPWYRVMDVLAFPSFREGFPNAPLEAAATALPVVGYAATGTVDAVADGETGLLVPAGDAAALAAALAVPLADPELGRRLGAAGRERVERRFRRERVWEAWARLYGEP